MDLTEMKGALRGTGTIKYSDGRVEERVYDHPVTLITYLNWQPIETAPADGTWVLLYFPADENRERPAICAAAQYNRDFAFSDDGPDCWRGPYSDGYDSGADDLGVFTHWAPMPEGPR